MNCFVNYVCDSLDLLNERPSTAFALACILVDATSKHHYMFKHNATSVPPISNKRLYKEFVKDYQSIILGVGKIRLIVKGDITIGGKLFEDIIYQDVRCALLHEAVQKIVISDGIVGGVNGTLHFDDIVRGLVYSCILAKCNSNITSNTERKIQLNESEYLLDNLWGKEDIFWDYLTRLISDNVN